MPPRHRTRSAEELFHTVEYLHTLPFPRQEERAGDRWGGPGHHLVVLVESQDFWEGRATELVEEAEQGVEADRAALAQLLTRRWGAPAAMDLNPFQDSGRTGTATGTSTDADTGLGFDAEEPEPFGFLSGVTSEVWVWRPDGSDRWVGLAVGQADPEWPLQLLAAFGESSALPV
ncbi:hypothetical protein ABTX82_05385 [Streptomyces lavendulae]|uniref:hypothetical protein n=1 Tax=Streptomyces lavendulae TaxID=1914 RepID=UPI00255653C4|nr:hypothetical protein [Streptomyces lavendulae]